MGIRQVAATDGTAGSSFQVYYKTKSFPTESSGLHDPGKEGIDLFIAHPGSTEIVPGTGREIHRCRICGALSSNRIAADDNPLKLMSLAMKPVALPPFPLERMEEMARLMGGDGAFKW